MSFATHTQGKTEFITCDRLPVPHCFSTRNGGVSEGCYGSLNLGFHRGDLPENVVENYTRLGQDVGFDTKNLVFTRQVHTDTVRIVTSQDRGEGIGRPISQDCDGLITQDRNVALTIFTADCVPILLYDPTTQTIGAIHAGWRGTALGIVRRGVERMCTHFGCNPAHISAAIGPCIGPCCFETNQDVPHEMMKALGDEALPFIRPVGEKYFVEIGRAHV